MKIWTMYVVLGAVSFWGPELIVKAVTNRPAPELLATVLLSGLWTTYAIVWRRRGSSPGPSLALCMLIGIFLFGPWCMVFTKTLVAGGFHSVRSWQDVLPVAASTLVLIIYALQPLFTLKMSADDSSFYGLLLAAISLIMVHFIVERHRWILPFFPRNSKVSSPSNRG